VSIPASRKNQAVSIAPSYSSAGSGRPGAAEPPAGFRYFAPDSIWNKPLRDDVPLHPQSADYVSWLRMSVSLNGTDVNSVKCAMPVYWAYRI
jgi:hypothetical protein